MKITVKELAELTNGKILFGDPDFTFENISTNSRALKGNDLFVPIVGENTDGHKYIASAYDNGASVSLSENSSYENLKENYGSNKAMVLVNSTIDALQEFATLFRERYAKIPFVGVTGSVGKTTTREMIVSALKSEMNVYSTKGNANSQVGVPITVFETEPNAQIAVVELGISEFGEMNRIAKVCGVETAVVTNIGICHMAQFKTQENILKEKIQILSNSKKSCRLLVNGDDPILQSITKEKLIDLGIDKDKEVEILRYGLGEKNDFRAVKITKLDGYPSFEYSSKGNNGIHVDLSVPGDHMILNAIAAMAVAEIYGLDLNQAAKTLGEFNGFEGRGNQIVINGIDVINDCYNASPISMMSGLKVLSDKAVKGRKIAVLANMLELGEDEENHHRKIGRFINEQIKDLDILYTYGELAKLIADEVHGNSSCMIRSYSDIGELKKDLWNEARKGDLIFLKGSYSMGLKRLIE